VSQLGETFVEAMKLWDRMKAEGVSLEERRAVMERTLRAAWPQSRVWHYYCDRCDDTGWHHKTCTSQMPCGRPFKLPKQSADDWTGRGRCAPGHTYVEPCLCEKGRTRLAQLMKERRVEDEVAMAAKASKPPSRFGR
jgi:hypothetical protein